jgi:alpha-L-fucosidase
VSGQNRAVAIACAAGLAVATLAPRPGAAGGPEDAKAQAILKTVDVAVAAGPFAAAWPSLERYEVPAWYRDGKFGIFIHWGLYSVPAFGNEWYPRNMYKQGTPEFAHHVATFGPQAKFGYKDFIPQFKAERFSAAGWARLFKEAGARFVVPVAEHHDGFPMYDCSLTEWSAAKMGPKRDLVGELARAVPAEGLVFGLSSHRAEHWWFLDGGTEFDSDVKDPRYAAFYGPARPQKRAEDQSEPPTREYLDDWLARTAEIVDKYRPQLVWFDWWIEQPVFEPYLRRFAAFYYNRGAQWQKGVAINYKNASFPAKAAVFDVERGQLPGIRPEFWQTDTSISKNSWGYVSKQDYKTAGAIVDDLVDIVSKNGALLLNIGPRPDGTIPEPEQEILREIGRWLKTNGEAIYGTRPWAAYGEGPTGVVGGSFNDTKRQAFTGRDIRFTTKPGALYAIALAWPGKTFTVEALGTGATHAKGRVTHVRLLGHEGALGFTQDAVGLHVTLPEKAPGEHAFAFRVEGVS